MTVETNPQPSYVPRDLEECTRFIIDCCSMPDVMAYTGHSEAQYGIAMGFAEQVFEPDTDVVPGLQRLLEERAERERQPRLELVFGDKPEVTVPTMFVTSGTNPDGSYFSFSSNVGPSRVSA